MITDNIKQNKVGVMFVCLYRLFTVKYQRFWRTFGGFMLPHNLPYIIYLTTEIILTNYNYPEAKYNPVIWVI